MAPLSRAQSVPTILHNKKLSDELFVLREWIKYSHISEVFPEIFQGDRGCARGRIRVTNKTKIENENEHGNQSRKRNRTENQSRKPKLTLLEPQSRFGDIALKLQAVCPPKRDCGSKRVKATAKPRIKMKVRPPFLW